MLARRLTTMLPAMRLADALETTRMHRVAGLTGARTALVTRGPFRPPPHSIAAIGLIGGGRCRCPARGCWRTRGRSCWMTCRRAVATCARCCANRWRTVFYTYHLPHVIDFTALAVVTEPAARVQTAQAREPFPVAVEACRLTARHARRRKNPFPHTACVPSRCRRHQPCCRAPDGRLPSRPAWHP
jgi:hypothetical protein